MKKYVMPAIVAAAVMTGAPVLAADLKPVYKAAPPPPVAFNPWDVAVGGALMTDYNFRGISQSARSPAGTAYFEGRYKPIKDIEFYAGVAGLGRQAANRSVGRSSISMVVCVSPWTSGPSTLA